MNLNGFRSVRLVLALSALISMSACGDYSIRLPGGYCLVRIYAGAVLISHGEKGVAIDANIDGYEVIGDLVVGHVIAADLPPEKTFSKPGYFILNTKSNEITQGLDKKVWLDSVQALGVHGEPRLSKPSRFDKNY
jgi:hypothetical protein